MSTPTPPDTDHGFAERLVLLREEKGLTRYALAKRAGITATTLTNIEEKGADPQLSTVLALAGGLGVPVRDLFAAEG